ncbi:hypothetical protein Tco_0131195, partial [Tanacetum coccineum]
FTTINKMSTSATHNAIMKAGGKDRAPMLVAGSYMMDHPAKKLLRFIQLNLQDVVCRHIPEKQELIDAEAETVHVILTGIDNDIYSTVDACANAKEMWLAIERLMQARTRSEDCSYHKLFDILKQHMNEVNEIRAVRLARNANPLALVTAIQHQPGYYPPPKPNYNPPPSTTRSQAATRSK